MGRVYERVAEGKHAVPGEPVAMTTRFRWRAERRARHLNAQRTMPSYRYEARRIGRRWWVIAFQNYLMSG